MTNRRSFIKGAGAIGGVALTSGCIGEFGSKPYSDGTLTFVMSPTEPQEYMEKQYKPVKEYLSKQVADNVTVKLQYAKNYSAVLRALAEGNAELAETGPFAAALGVKGEQCEIALQRHAYGSWTYHSVLVTREETDITKPSDLKGKKIAFADTTSASGSLYPLYMLQQAGLDIGKAPLSDEGADFSASWSGHAQAFKSLKEGQVDAAGVGRFITWNYEKGDYKKGIAEVAKESGIPRAPIVASPKLKDKKQDMLVSSLEQAPDKMYYGADGEKGTDDDLWFDGVREASLETYQPVIDVANELGIKSDLLDKA